MYCLSCHLGSLTGLSVLKELHINMQVCNEKRRDYLKEMIKDCPSLQLLSISNTKLEPTQEAFADFINCALTRQFPSLRDAFMPAITMSLLTFSGEWPS